MNLNFSKFVSRFLDVLVRNELVEVHQVLQSTNFFHACAYADLMRDAAAREFDGQFPVNKELQALFAAICCDQSKLTAVAAALSSWPNFGVFGPRVRIDRQVDGTITCIVFWGHLLSDHPGRPIFLRCCEHRNEAVNDWSAYSTRSNSIFTQGELRF